MYLIIPKVILLVILIITQHTHHLNLNKLCAQANDRLSVSLSSTLSLECMESN